MLAWMEDRDRSLKIIWNWKIKDARNDIHPRECTEFRVPMYWENSSKVPDMGTSKILSNFINLGTALGTHSSMYTEQVFV